MNKEKIRSEIRKDFEYILHKLYMYPTVLEIIFEDEELYEHDDEDIKEAISVVLKYPYKHILLHVPKKGVTGIEQFLKDRKDFRETLIHEAMHVKIWEVVHIGELRYTSEERIRDADEKTTDELTLIVRPLFKDFLEHVSHKEG